MIIAELFDRRIPKAGGPETDVYHILKRLINKHSIKLFKGGQAYVVPSGDGKSVYRFWTKDDGYEEWLKVALTMQDNPHIVKVLSKVRTIDDVNFKNSVGPIKFVKLEKLEPEGPNKVEIGIADYYFRLARRNTKSAEIATMSTHHFISNACMLPSYMDIDEETEQWMYDKANFDFIDTYRQLDAMGYNDIGGDNIMFRGSVPVFTDPLNLKVAKRD